MPLLGGSQREARETAQRLSRPVAHRESGFPCLGSRGCTPGNSRGLHPGQFAAECLRCQFAPGGGELRSRLCEPPVHVRVPVPPLSIRGGCTPGNSRRSASAVNSRPWQLASLVLIEPPAHVRGPVPGLSIRATGRRLNAASVRATSARARRGLCVILSPPLGRGPSAAQKRKLGKQRPQARLFQQGGASQAAGWMRLFFQKSCKKPFTFGTLAQYTGG